MAERAEALLAQVQRVVRFDAGWITLLPPEQESHVPLARSGYDQRVCGYMDSTSFLADVELVGPRRSRRPVRGRDLPFPPSGVPGWAEYVEPAGFRDGVSTGLFTPEGHYLGVLALPTQGVDQVSDPHAICSGCRHHRSRPPWTRCAPSPRSPGWFAGPPRASCSPRPELQVLGLLVTDASNERIARGLHITAGTVALHVDHVRAKLPALPHGGRRAGAAAGAVVPSSLLGVRT